METISPSGDPRSAECSDEALRAWVTAVTSRGLEVPALFLLQAALPLHSLLQQALYVAHPLLQPWWGDRLLLWADLLEDTRAIERVMMGLLDARGRLGSVREGTAHTRPGPEG